MSRRLVSLAVLPLLAVAACERAEVAPGDSSGIEARLAEMQSDMQTLKSENAALRRAMGVDSTETAATSEALQKRGDQIARLEARVARQDAEIAALRAAGGAAASESGDVPVSVPPSLQPAADGNYTDEQLVAFGKMFDAHQKKRDAEEQLKRLRQTLTREGVTLTPEQEAAVIRLQKQFQEKRRDLYQPMAGGMMNEADREAVRTKSEELRVQFETEVRSLVPSSADADKLVEALKKNNPGFFPGARSERRPGMGGR